MSHPNRPSLPEALVLALLALALAGCATGGPLQPAAPQSVSVPLLPPAFLPAAVPRP